MEISENINGLIRSNWEPGALRICGVQLGDHADTISRDSIVDSTRRGVPIKEVIEFSTLPLEERIRGAIRFGGWIHTSGGFNFCIDSGKVVKFGLNSEALSDINIESEEVIPRIFGSPDHHRQIYRNGVPSEAEYYYSNKKLLFVWSNIQNKVFNINIGGTDELHNASQTQAVCAGP